MTRKTVLLDFDDTLVNFNDAEEFAFYALAENYQLTLNEQDLITFKEINQAHWEAFQNEGLTKEEVLSKRFEAYFALHKMNVNGAHADQVFRDALANAPLSYFEHTLTTLRQLSKVHDLYIVTNGVLETQEKRIAKSLFKDYFKGVFVSEQTGFQKPMPEFFDYVFNTIGHEKRKNSIIIGDSLTSDILGGKNAAIATCWFNPRQNTNNTQIHADYTIQSFDELLTII